MRIYVVQFRNPQFNDDGVVGFCEPRELVRWLRDECGRATAVTAVFDIWMAGGL